MGGRPARPGGGAGPAPWRKPGLGASGGGRGAAAGVPPVPNPAGGTDLPGRAARSFGEWAGDESPAPGHPPAGWSLLLGGGFFNLLANSASVTAHSFPPLASLPGGSVPASRCAFQVTWQSTFCGEDCTCCCWSVRLVELAGRLRWAKSFKNYTKYSDERKTQQTRPQV